MKIFLLEPRTLSDPSAYLEYARFAHVGTWSDHGLCEACGQNLSHLEEPLEIEWEPDADRIGDFAYCGYTVAVNQKVRDYLVCNHYEFAFGEVRVVRPAGRSGGRRQVAFPYVGPQLFWLRAKEQVELNEARSGIRLKLDCPACGKKDYGFKRDGIMIDKTAWKGQKVFEIKQFDPSGVIFITEEGLNRLIQERFTNIGFHECGTIA
jgi:hypothetical protein